MEKEKINEQKEMIETLYKSQLEKIDKIIIEKNKELKNKIKENEIDSILNNIENKKEQEKIIKLLNNIEENYNIKISEYNKVMYKQGFIDGINLILECLN